jgi:hypothetical protein
MEKEVRRLFVGGRGGGEADHGGERRGEDDNVLPLIDQGKGAPELAPSGDHAGNLSGARPRPLKIQPKPFWFPAAAPPHFQFSF